MDLLERSREVPASVGHRDDLRPPDAIGVASVNDGRGPTSHDVLEPVTPRPVHERDHETVVRRRRPHRCLVRRARRPPTMPDHRCERSWRASRSHLDSVAHRMMEATGNMSHGGAPRSDPEHVQGRDCRDHRQQRSRDGQDRPSQDAHPLSHPNAFSPSGAERPRGDRPRLRGSPRRWALG